MTEPGMSSSRPYVNRRVRPGRARGYHCFGGFQLRMMVMGVVVEASAG
jgi:hypothetical protein